MLLSTEAMPFLPVPPCIFSTRMREGARGVCRDSSLLFFVCVLVTGTYRDQRFLCPGKVLCVLPSDFLRIAHIGQCAHQGRGLDFSGQEAVHNTLMSSIAGRILFKDPFTWFRAEEVTPPVVVKSIRPQIMLSLRVRWGDDRNLTDIAGNRERLGQCLCDFPFAGMGSDDIPPFAPGIIPSRILGFQPRP